MKIHLSLTKSDFQTLENLVVACGRAIEGDSFGEVAFRDALTGLGVKMWSRTFELKERRNSLTLTDCEALALWHVFGDLADKMPPYEQGLAARVIMHLDAARLESLRQRNACAPPRGGAQQLSLNV